jgi:hypothetical protein
MFTYRRRLGHMFLTISFNMFYYIALKYGKGVLMSVGVMTVGVMSVGEITVGVMTVGVMRRPRRIVHS